MNSKEKERLLENLDHVEVLFDQYIAALSFEASGKYKNKEIDRKSYDMVKRFMMDIPDAQKKLSNIIYGIKNGFYEND